MKRLSSLLLLVFFHVTIIAQLGGNSVFTSLDIPASARVAAMGGALPTVHDGDLNLALYNPALLDSMMHRATSLSYVNYFSGINLGFASYAHHLDSSNITLGGHIQYVDYGSFTERDASNTELGSFRAGDYALIIGASLPVDSLFTAGVSLKAIYSNLASYDAWGLAIDGGVTYQNPARQFSASLVVRNLGLQMDGYRDGVKDTLPLNIQVGIAKRLKHAPFRFSLVFDQLQQWDLAPESDNTVVIDPLTGLVVENTKNKFGDRLMRHVIIGTEFLVGESFKLNMGYNYRRRQELKLEDRPGTAGFSWGIGLNMKRFALSYGRAIYHFAGPSNHFTLTTKLSDW